MTALLLASLWLAESAIPAACDYARTGGLSLYADQPVVGISDPYDITVGAGWPGGSR